MFENFKSILLRGFVVWLIIIFAEFIHGTLRVFLLQPIVGDFSARQIAVFSGMVIILIISLILVRWMRAENNSQLIAVGVFWLILTLSFEILLGRFGFNLSWERIFSDYNILNGGLLPIGLIFLVFAPLIAENVRKTFF